MKAKVTKACMGVEKLYGRFLLVIGLFIILLMSGALTGDGPFGTRDNDQDNNGGQTFDFEEGESQFETLSAMCVDHSGVGSHYHYKIFLAIDGSTMPLPANIGISNSCMKPLHTHSTDNQVHVELPIGYSGSSPTLGDFFMIWGQSLSSTSLMGHSGTVNMKVNSQEYTGDFNNFVPSDGDIITLSVTS